MAWKILRPLSRSSPAVKSTTVIPDHCEESDDPHATTGTCPEGRRHNSPPRPHRESRPKPSAARRKALFDLKRTNETTFWRSYQAMEHLKAGEVGLWASVKMGVRWLVGQIVNSYILRNPTSHIDEEDGNEFLWFFLRRAGLVGLSVFALNVVSMLCMVGIVLMYTRHEIDNDKDLPRAELVTFFARFMIPWLVLSLLCGAFFSLVLIFDRCPSSRRFLSSAQLLSLWRMLAAIILFSRYIVLVSNALWSLMQHYDTGGDSCPESQYLSQISDGSLEGELFLIMCAFEMLQIAFVALVPFPFPWILRVSLAEMCAMLVRVRTCAHIFGEFPMKRNFTIGVISLILVYYTFCVSIPVISFESSMRTSFINIKRQQVAASEKMQVVNMLCQEIKLPAQKLLHSLQMMVGKSVTSSLGVTFDLKTHIRDANRISGTLNAVVDDMLFLAKVEEQRFTMHCQDLVVLRELVRDTTELLCHSLDISLPSHDLSTRTHTHPLADEFQTDRCSMNLCSCSVTVDRVYSQQQCMRVMFRLSFLSLLLLRCEDKPERISQYLAGLISKEGELENVRDHVPFFVSISPISRPPHAVRFIVTFRHKGLPHHNTEKEKTPRERAKERIPSGGALESTCLACRKIADASLGGNWEIFLDRVEFTLPCVFTAEEEMSKNGHELPTEARVQSDVHTDCESFERAPSEVELSCDLDENDKHSDGAHFTSKQEKKKRTDALTHKHRNTKRKQKKTSIKNRKRVEYTSFPPEWCCVYLTDPSFEPAVMDIVHTLWKKTSVEEVMVLRHSHITAAHLKAFSVLFVQSIETCKELREKGFNGTLVLLSERLVYLDAEERRCFDFGLAVPGEVNALLQLSKLLSQLRKDNKTISTLATKLKENAKIGGNVNNTSEEEIDHIERDNNGYLHHGAASAISNYNYPFNFLFSPRPTRPRPRPSLLSPNTQPRRGGFSSWLKHLFTHHLWHVHRPTFTKKGSHTRLESFFMWRFFSPVRNMPLHHSYSTGVASVAISILYLVNTLNGLFPLATTIGWSLYTVIFYFRQNLFFRIFHPRRITLVNVWTFLAIALNLSSIVRDLITLKIFLGDFMSGTKLLPKGDSLSEFIEIKRSFFSGSTMVFYAIVAHASIRLHWGSMPSSWGLLTSTLVFIRAALIVVYILAPFISTIVLLLYVVVFTTLLLLSYVLEFFVHQCNVESFTSLYELLLSKDFLDRTLLLGKIQLSAPLQQQLSLQITVLEFRTKEAMRPKENNEEVFFAEQNNALFELRDNVSLSRDLIFQLNALGDPHFFAAWNRGRFLSSMKATLLQKTIQEICERLLVFCAPSAGPSVRIFAKIDPALTLVKVPVRLLSVVLFSSCKKVIHDILRARSRSTSPKDDGELDIIISAFPLTSTGEPEKSPRLFSSSASETTKNMRFMDVRLLALDILTSSNGPEVDQIVAENISSHSLCEKYVRFFKVIPRDRRKCSRELAGYRSAQQLLLPYFLCPDSFKLHRLTEHRYFPLITHVEYSSFSSFSNTLKALHKYYSISLEEQKKYSQDHVPLPNRKVIMVCDCESTQMGKIIGFKDSFRIDGWTCHVQLILTLAQFISVVSKDLQRDPYHCIIFDIDFQVKFPTNGSFQLLDAQDCIHFLRTIGYHWLIGVIDTFGSSESTNGRGYHRDRVRKPNPHVIAEKPDFFLTSLTKLNSKRIIEEAIQRKLTSNSLDYF